MTSCWFLWGKKNKKNPKSPGVAVCVGSLVSVGEGRTVRCEVWSRQCRRWKAADAPSRQSSAQHAKFRKEILKRTFRYQNVFHVSQSKPARLDERFVGRNSEIKRGRKSLDFLTGDKGQTAESQSGFIWRVCHVTIGDTCEACRSSGLFCWLREVLIKLTTLQHAHGERPSLLCLWGSSSQTTLTGLFTF